MLTQLVASWASFYSDHAAARTLVEFLHVGGLTAGGGCAIAADLATLASRAQDTHDAPSRVVQRAHRIVVPGLVALTTSGLLLFAADVDTFLVSRVFWLKMILVVLLLVNGVAIVSSDRQASRGSPEASGRLRRGAVISLTLWALTTLAGAALPNIG